MVWEHIETVWKKSLVQPGYQASLNRKKLMQLEVAKYLKEGELQGASVTGLPWLLWWKTAGLKLGAGCMRRLRKEIGNLLYKTGTKTKQHKIRGSSKIGRNILHSQDQSTNWLCATTFVVGKYQRIARDGKHVLLGKPPMLLLLLLHQLKLLWGLMGAHTHAGLSGWCRWKSLCHRSAR